MEQQIQIRNLLYLFIELTLDTACTLGLGRETLASVASGAGGDPRKAEIEAQPPAPSPETEGTL